MWFKSWDRIVTTVAAGIVIYVFVIVVLRTSGKRTLAKLNAFDFVVTIAIGSTVASGVVSRMVPVVEAAVALATLVSLQLAVAVAVRRWPRVRQAVTSAPTALLVDGELRADALSASRIAASEVAAAVRKEGFGSLGEIDCVVLETDGSLSVIADSADGSALRDVELGDGRPAP